MTKTLAARLSIPSLLALRTFYLLRELHANIVTFLKLLLVEKEQPEISADAPVDPKAVSRGRGRGHGCGRGRHRHNTPKEVEILDTKLLPYIFEDDSDTLACDAGEKSSTINTRSHADHHTMASPPNEGAIVPRQGNVSFQQNGSIDWVKLTSSTVTFSADVLARLSNKGVEPITLVAAQAAVSSLRLGSEGEQRALKAISQLQCFSTLNNALWLGFGAKHLVRQLSESAEGLNCIVLCSALSEFYSIGDAASIIRSLVTSLGKLPAELTPSLSQWQALVKACGGAFAATEFGLIIHNILALAAPGVIKYPRRRGDPKDVAEAIRNIMALSNGSQEYLLVFAGKDCGFLAAFASWFLALPVDLRGMNGQTIYRSYSTPMDPRLEIIYGDGPPRLAKSRALVSSGSVPVHEILDKAKYASYTAASYNTASYGRVPWQSILQDTFGPSIREALSGETSTSFGTALGSAARLYTEFFTTKKIPESALEASSISSSRLSLFALCSCHGLVFVIMLQQVFPEIAKSRRLVNAIEIGLNATFEDAILMYNRSISQMRNCSSCKSCSSRHGEEDIYSLPHMCGSANPDPYNVTPAADVLVETLVDLMQLLSNVILPIPILPSRIGLAALYRIRRANIKCCSHFHPIQTLLLSSLIGAQSSSFLQLAGLFYTGSTPEVGRRSSAISSNGLCFFCKSIEALPRNTEQALAVQIAPGHIEWNGKTFAEILDAEIDALAVDENAHLREEISRKPISVASCTRLEDRSPDLFHYDLIVEETMDSSETVQIMYRFSKEDGCRYMIPPQSLATKILGASTGRNCAGKMCGPMPSGKIVPLRGQCKAIFGAPGGGPQPLFVANCSRNLPALLVTLYQWAPGYMDTGGVMLLQGKQCLRCLLAGPMERAKEGKLGCLCIITSQ